MSEGIQDAAAPSTAAPTAGSTFDAASISRSLRYESSSVPESILQDMVKLREFDRGQERKMRTWGIGAAVSFCVLVVGVVCLVGGATILGVVLLAIGLVAIIASVVILTKTAGLNLDDRRYEIVVGLLGLLGKDMAADQPLKLNLDFRNHNDKVKLLREGKSGRWNVKFYVDRWLEMSGRFLDGTKYSVTLIQKHQDRSCTKRSASGKTKHKSKTKSASEAIVSIRFKEKRYPNVQQSQLEIHKTVKLPDWVELKSIKAEGDLLTIRATTVVEWASAGPDNQKVTHDGVHWLAMMFMNLYQHLNRGSR